MRFHLYKGLMESLSVNGHVSTHQYIFVLIALIALYHPLVDCAYMIRSHVPNIITVNPR